MIIYFFAGTFEIQLVFNDLFSLVGTIKKKKTL